MTVKLVVLPPALAASIVGGAVVKVAVGATVSTVNVARLGLAATALTPAVSVTWLATRLTVYVPCVLAPQLAAGALIV